MQLAQKPTVFVSSTCYDLKQVREDLKEFIENNYGFEALLSEFDSFPIDPCVGTFENCLNNVDKHAGVFILIIGNRYGFVTDQGKSITNLEYLHAKAKGIPIFVFVSKNLYNSLPVWRNNKNGDYSPITDNSKIFEFIAEIYDSAHQWVYTFESAHDIKMTLKNQWALTFFDGLKYNKIVSSNHNSILLNNNSSSEAARIIIEQPYAWEYKFLAVVLKNEFDRLQVSRWDFNYGFFAGNVMAKAPTSLIDDISEKMQEILKLIDCLGVVLNTTIQDSIGEPGEPSNLEMMMYKQFASLYQRLISWGLYFKSLHVDEKYAHLVDLLYELPSYALKSIDHFVNQLYNEVMSLPDVDDNVTRSIKVTCSLDGSNTGEINEEINRLLTTMDTCR